MRNTLNEKVVAKRGNAIMQLIIGKHLSHDSGNAEGTPVPHAQGAPRLGWVDERMPCANVLGAPRQA